jgi:hypothetical protein
VCDLNTLQIGLLFYLASNLDTASVILWLNAYRNFRSFSTLQFTGL